MGCATKKTADDGLAEIFRSATSPGHGFHGGSNLAMNRCHMAIGQNPGT